MARPWYRHFWVWFMLTPLIATVIASFVTLFLAGGPPALVVDDFGRIAMALEEDQRRDRRAAELQLEAGLQFAGDAAGGTMVAVDLSGAAPGRLRLELIHPTLSRLDQEVLLQPHGGLYSGAVNLADSRLYVQLTDEAGDWRLTGQLARNGRTLRLESRR